MSKQYLTSHTIDNAHPADIFALTSTETQIISASGSSHILIHATNHPEFPLVQKLEKAHALGCHHLSASGDGTKFASVGFGGEIKLWKSVDGKWEADGRIEGISPILLLSQPETDWKDGMKAGEAWAISLSKQGDYLASTTVDGRINVWETEGSRRRIRQTDTKGSFGTAIDISADGTKTASGHQNGAIYVFSNDTGRLLHSLPSLAKPVRAVQTSPACTLLAAAGDARVIALYDVNSGEQIANFLGHGAWVLSLSWSWTGEYLLSGAFDGKTKVWSIETRECVATHTETEKAVWAAKWLPKVTGRGESFAVGGANRSLSFYREATGG